MRCAAEVVCVVLLLCTASASTCIQQNGSSTDACLLSLLDLAAVPSFTAENRTHFFDQLSAIPLSTLSGVSADLAIQLYVAAVGHLNNTAVSSLQYQAAMDATATVFRAQTLMASNLTVSRQKSLIAPTMWLFDSLATYLLVNQTQAGSSLSVRSNSTQRAAATVVVSAQLAEKQWVVNSSLVVRNISYQFPFTFATDVQPLLPLRANDSVAVQVSSISAGTFLPRTSVFVSEMVSTVLRVRSTVVPVPPLSHPITVTLPISVAGVGPAGRAFTYDHTFATCRLLNTTDSTWERNSCFTTATSRTHVTCECSRFDAPLAVVLACPHGDPACGGCDGLLYSATRLDACGVCNGNGSSCAPATVQEVVVAADYLSFDVLFDVDTDKAGANTLVQCNLVFDSATWASLGSASQCWWVSTRLLRVVLGTAPTLTFSTIKFDLDFVLKVSPLSLRFDVSKAYPFAPLPPAIAVQAALAASSVNFDTCQPAVRVSAAMSSGQAGRAFASVAWSLTGSTSMSTAQRNAVNSYLGSQTGVEVELRWQDILGSAVPAGSHTLSATVTNWLGQSSTAALALTVSPTPTPSVRIDGPTTVSTLMRTPLLLLASIHRSTCPSVAAGATSHLTFEWSLSSTTVAAFNALPRTSRSLRIPGRTLPVGTHTIAFTVTDSTSLASAQATLLVTVASSPPVVLLKSSIALHSVSKPLTISALSSYDPDTNSISPLSFAWSCAYRADEAPMTAPYLPCPAGLIPTPTSAFAVLPASAMDADRAYRFTVVATKGALSASASQLVRTTTASVPIVAITPLAAAKVSPTARVQLTSTVDLGGLALFLQTWSVHDGPTTFLNPDTTLAGTGLARTTLWLKPAVLLAGFVYRMRFTVQTAFLGTTATGYAELDIMANSPPGMAYGLSVSPSFGVALQPVFTLTAGQWVDSDLPLSYEFAVETLWGAASVTPRQASSVVSAIGLPAGSSSSNLLPLLVFVSDSLGAVSSSTTTVVVEPPAAASSNSDGYAEMLVSNELSSAVSAGDVLAAATLVSSVCDLARRSTNATAARLLRNNVATLLNNTANSLQVPVEAQLSSLTVAASSASSPPAQVSVSAAAGLVSTVGKVLELRLSLAASLGVQDATTVVQTLGNIVSSLAAAARTNPTATRRLLALSLQQQQQQSVWLSLEASMGRLASLVLLDTIVNEEATVISTQFVSLVTQRVGVSSWTSRKFEGDNGVSVTLPSTLFSDVFFTSASLRIVSFPLRLNPFGWAGNVELLSAITAVTVLPWGSTTLYSPTLSPPAKVSLLLTNAGSPLPGNMLTCVLWDSASLAWSTSGCQRTTPPDRFLTGNEFLECTCTRLAPVAAMDVPVGCDFVPYSGLVFDTCGVCGGDNSTCVGCNSVLIPLGGFVYDACGVCGGNGSSCLDCSGVPAGGKVIDSCGFCGGLDLTCSYRGTCDVQRNCVCPGNFGGDRCDRCVANYYPSSSCTVFCAANTTCSGHGQCSSQGTCVCQPTFFGASCSQCRTDWYPLAGPDMCTRRCNSAVCNHAGACNPMGRCECSPNTITGDYCEACLPQLYDDATNGRCSKLCSPAATCNGHGGCSVTGDCACQPGWAPPFCSKCLSTYFPADSCTVYCDHYYLCGGHGSCNNAGTCDCGVGFVGSRCDLCAENYYGSACAAFCVAFSTCQDRGYCSMTGTCVCRPPFAGPSCTNCLPNYFGTRCDVFCSRDVTCNGHGACTVAGQCQCDVNVMGVKCDTCAANYFEPFIGCPTFCQASTTCSGHGSCDTVGRCVCESSFVGPRCNQCTPERYGSACALVCNDIAQCNFPRGSCSSTGACTCVLNYAGADCSSCQPGYYGLTCETECREGPSGAHCQPPRLCRPTGQCGCPGNFAWDGVACSLCEAFWYGSQCTRFCNSETCQGHGVCNNSTGACLCDPPYAGDTCEGCVPNYFGTACLLYCKLGDNCESPQRCDTSTGLCGCAGNFIGQYCDKCATGWYSSACDVRCDPFLDCSGHGTCNRDLSCVCEGPFRGRDCSQCLPDLYGPSCDVSCQAASTCTGRGTCGPNDGLCVCPDPWTGPSCQLCIPPHYGPACALYCLASTTCNGHGSCNGLAQCVCEPGFMQPNCAACIANRYGPKCEVLCSNTVCNGKSSGCSAAGVCVCLERFTGAFCDSCAPGYFSGQNISQCDVQCNADITCFSHGSCSATGRCVCDGQYTSSDCTKCLPKYFGHFCERYCDDTTTCTGHGTCVFPGYCVCNDGFNGRNCDTCLPARYGLNCSVFCLDCGGRGSCLSTGLCLCEGNYQGSLCLDCMDDFFGPSCTLFCTREASCSGHGSCSPLGTCVCDVNWDEALSCSMCLAGWGGTDCTFICTPDSCNGLCLDDGTCVCVNNTRGDTCNECIGEFYGPNCERFCVAETTCLGHGQCESPQGQRSVGAGLCTCDEFWTGFDCGSCLPMQYGPNCAVFCDANTTCSRRGVCLADGMCACDTHYYGDNCQIHCPPDKCLTGFCDTTTGKCVCPVNWAGPTCGRCAPNYYGDQCETFCDAKVTCTGRGACNATGQCVCPPTHAGPDCLNCLQADQYGPFCKVSCLASVHCNGHGACRALDGVCVCSQNYTGFYCAFNTPPVAVATMVVKHSAGAVVRAKSGSTVTVPAGAIKGSSSTGSTQIDVLSYATTAAPPARNISVAIAGGFTVFKPEGLTFAEGAAATLTLHYPVGAVPADHTAFVMLYDEYAFDWVEVPGSLPNYENFTVSVQVQHFSRYAVFKQPSTAPVRVTPAPTPAPTPVPTPARPDDGLGLGLGVGLGLGLPLLAGLIYLHYRQKRLRNQFVGELPQPNGGGGSTRSQLQLQSAINDAPVADTQL